MIAYAVLVLKDTFAPRFENIQTIPDSVEFLENYEVILAKLSSSCCYMISFSFFFVVFIFCKVPPWGLGGLSRECVLRIPMRVVKGD